MHQEACVAALNTAIAAAQQKLVELNEEKGDSADLCGGSLKEVSKLDKRKRGEKVEVVVKGKYGGYDLDDITRLCRAVDNEEIKANWLKAGRRARRPWRWRGTRHRPRLTRPSPRAAPKFWPLGVP